ncbi:MBL fold metallo-hydrolase [Xylophilus sp.]|uniref:MBL fold metallo-hydrolase n=1 Tax=Xylophilus sp. TaxID=2653893 RepID=UPI0013BC0076|nr:MBL fold metallo-hydrolase [Xylophilus sp.]KAF1048982.1 MAG: Hydroxyacylglutathione hydrolase GloC [Xylophilus sp.]
MPRPSQQLLPPHSPAPARAAATVVLLRDMPGGAGVEVLMTRRSHRASFAPSAYVFPGGGIDASDADPATHALADHREDQDAQQRTQAIAAIRESFEELGVLLARDADGRFVDGERFAGLDRTAPLAPQIAGRGWRLAADAVFVLARWLTGLDRPQRFDVPFLVARMPEGQVPVADGSEQFEPVWVRPADALARHAAGGFEMIFPTVRTLRWLQAHAAVDAVIAACAGGRPLWTSTPRAGLLGGKEARYMEHEPPYGELVLATPDGQVLHPLDWQHERPVPLLKNVQRLTVGNPGVMTGPGTNSYLVGDAASGYLAIDPGPLDEVHLRRLHDAAGGDIRWIVCTHSHADHSPGAAPLAALVESAGRPRPPVLGLPSADTARPASFFRPDRALAHGERIVLEGGGLTHTLEALHTPGHAANHVCLLLLEDGLLFSGDHILNGSTTVIDPPDGDMTAYLASLDLLAAACARHGVEFILPAHGYVLGPAPQAIAALKAHRLQREAKIAAALEALPDGTVDDWVAHAYADVPSRMWPVAARSLLAHVQRIRAGAVT